MADNSKTVQVTNKDKSICFRVTADDHRQALTNARSHGLKDELSAYFRMLLNLDTQRVRNKK